MPHVSKEGYKYICVKIDGKSRYYLEHRWIMEQHIGRRLTTDEVVHHLNENKLDNRIENLEILSREEHSRMHAPIAELSKHICPLCEKEFIREARDVRGNIKKGKAGPFCSRECAGKYGQAKQVTTRGGTTSDPSTWVHGTPNTYQYRKCRCELCKSANNEKKKKERLSKKR